MTCPAGQYCAVPCCYHSCRPAHGHRRELTRAASRTEGAGTQTVATVGVPVVEESLIAAPGSRQRCVCMHRRWQTAEYASGQSHQQQLAACSGFWAPCSHRAVRLALRDGLQQHRQQRQQAQQVCHAVLPELHGQGSMASTQQVQRRYVFYTYVYTASLQNCMGLLEHSCCLQILRTAVAGSQLHASTGCK